MYAIIDLQTKKMVSSAKTLRAASAAAERRNQAYGAIRYEYRSFPIMNRVEMLHAIESK